MLGGGPGGYAAALYGASAGMKVALVEKDKVGGTCLHRGCIPAKELLETASLVRHIQHASEFGVNAGPPSINPSVVQERKQKVIDQLFRGVSGLLKGRKVTVLEGTGTLGADGQGRVGGEILASSAVILAPGSVPRSLPGLDVDDNLVVNSDGFLNLSRIPRRAVVIGGGAIGLEFASTLTDWGTKVTVVEALDKILPGCDRDAADALARAFKKRGIETKVSTKVVRLDRRGAEGTVELSDGSEFDVDLVVVAIGRQANAGTLQLDGSGVEVDDRGCIVVDPYMRTTKPGVWAVGDAVATPQLAHVAFSEAIVAVRDILAENPAPIDYSAVPWGIYTFPEVAFAGLTEEAAREAGHEVVVAKHRFMGNSRALILGDTEGLVKVIAKKDPDDRPGQILGVHMVGPWVTEQLGQAYVSVNWQATVDDLAYLIQPHPTLSELFGETVLSMTGRGLHG